MAARSAPLFFSSMLVMLAVVSCASSPYVSSTQLSRAQLMGSGSPELRTLYNTGYVYPGGQTTEVSQGVAPGVVGRGGYLTRPPTKEVSRPLPPMSWQAQPSLPSAVERYETVHRVARAICDHAMYCERIGPAAVFESADACSTEQRARLVDITTKAGCRDTLPGDLVAACLREIRAATCNGDPSAMPLPCDQALSSCS